ncbi:hypothetical protein GCM10009664_58220 [Kitasatospora gansuensis]
MHYGVLMRDADRDHQQVLAAPGSPNTCELPPAGAPADGGASCPACGARGKPDRDEIAGADIYGELEAYRAALAGRDSLIHRAQAAGMSEAQIARSVGHSRTTVRSILAMRTPQAVNGNAEA